MAIRRPVNQVFYHFLLFFFFFIPTLFDIDYRARGMNRNGFIVSRNKKFSKERKRKISLSGEKNSWKIQSYLKCGSRETLDLKKLNFLKQYRKKYRKIKRKKNIWIFLIYFLRKLQIIDIFRNGGKNYSGIYSLYESIPFLERREEEEK